MAKRVKKRQKNGQALKNNPEEVAKRKKTHEREKRVKQTKAKNKTEFDLATETVIQMTNKNKIKIEEETKKKLAQLERKRKKRLKRIKLTVEIIVIVGLIAGSTTFAMVSPIFNIKDIQVVNNQEVSAQTVVSLSGLKAGENIFRFLNMQVKDNIKENAYIENVKIHRKIPDTIQIEVQERNHTFSVDFLGKYAYINNQGYILEIGEDSKQKPIIQGISTQEDQVVAGNRLNEEDLEKLQTILKIISVAKEYELDAEITSIDIKNKSEYSIYLEQEKKRIHLGDASNLSNKMLYVDAILEKEKDKSGDIFANGDLNDKFKIYFRESLNV